MIVSILDTLNVSEISIDWTVFITDGMDTVYADQIFTLNIDAYDVLNVDELLIPESYALHQNYPNPFNPTTTLKYDIPEATTVSAKSLMYWEKRLLHSLIICIKTLDLKVLGGMD